MPRCYMVKKGLSPLEGTPPCSPSEASVAPPCYTPQDHPTVAGPRSASYAAPACHVGTQYEKQRSGEYAEKSKLPRVEYAAPRGEYAAPRSNYTEPCGVSSKLHTEYNAPRGGYTDSRNEYTTLRGEVIVDRRDEYAEPRNGIYTVLRAAELTDPVMSHYAAEKRDSYSELRQNDYSEPKPMMDYFTSSHAQYTEPRTPRSGDYAEPRTVRYLERDLSSCNEPRAAEYAEPRSYDYGEKHTDRYDESRSADYAEPRSTQYDTSRATLIKLRSSPIKSEHIKSEHNQTHTALYESPRTEYSQPKLEEIQTSQHEEPHSEYVEDHDMDMNAQKSTEYNKNNVGLGTARNNEYAELRSTGSIVREHSAADTEAAHELLSLAAGVPPLPPAAVLTVLRAPEPVLPLYTYAIQPASIYIIAEEPTDPAIYATSVQTLAPLQQVEYTAQPQVNTYIAYQEPIAPPQMEYQQLYRASEPQTLSVPMSVSLSVSVSSAETLPLSMPVSVIETAPASGAIETAPQQLSIQVPVIEPVPLAQQYPPPASLSTSSPSIDSLSDSELDEPSQNGTCRKKYNCNECGKRYATSSNLSRHKQTHRSLDSQAAKRCGECGKVYVSMPALAMHVLTHRMGHVCGVCGKQFSRPWLLRGHLRSHTGEKPYNCQSCNKSFADRSNLRAHLQTHSSDKKWECVRCNKTFALKSYLNKHQEAACSQDEQDSQ